MNRQKTLIFNKKLMILMTLTLFIAIMLFCFNACFAQDNVNNAQQKVYQEKVMEAKYNNDKAQELFKQKKYDESIEYHKKALEICKELNFIELEINTLILVGIDYAAKKDYEKSIYYYKEAEKLNSGKYFNAKTQSFIAFEEKSVEAQYNFDKGQELFKQKKYDESIGYDQKALELYKELNFVESEINVLIIIGINYKLKNDYEKAIYYYKEAEKLNSGKYFNKNMQSMIYSDIVRSYVISRKYEKAIKTFEAVSALINESDYNMLTYHLGCAYNGIKDYEKALKYFYEALNYYPNKKLVYYEIASIYKVQNKLEDALKLYYKIIELAREENDINTEDVFLGGVTNLLIDLKRYDEAIEKCFKRYNLLIRVDEKRAMDELKGIALIYGLSGNFNKADEVYIKMYNQYKNKNDKRGMIDIINGRILLYGYANESEKVLEICLNSENIIENSNDFDVKSEFYSNAIDIFCELGDYKGVANYINKAEIILPNLNEDEKVKFLCSVAVSCQDIYPQKAVSFISEALKYKNSKEYPYVLLKFAELSYKNGYYRDAINALNEAIEYFLKNDNVSFLLESFESLAENYLMLNGLKESEEYAKKALELGKDKQKITANDFKRIYITLARIYTEKGDYVVALDYYKKAINYSRMTANEVALKDFRLKIHTKKDSSVYKEVIRLLCKNFQENEKRPEDVFNYMEESRSKDVLEMLERSNKQYIIPKDLANERKKILLQLNTLKNKLIDKSDMESNENEKEYFLMKINKLNNELLLVDKKIDNYKRKASPSIFIKTRDLKELQSNLDDDTTILEYNLGFDSLQLLAINEKNIKICQIPLPKDFYNIIEKYIDFMSKPILNDKSRKEFNDIGSKIFNIILSPAKESLKENLVIIPDGILCYLPYETLLIKDTDKKTLLVEEHNINYCNSATVFCYIKNKHKKVDYKNKLNILAIGDPIYDVKGLVKKTPKQEIAIRNGSFSRLENSYTEVKDIAEVFKMPFNQDNFLIRERANERTFFDRNLTKYDIIHFATHGILADDINYIKQPSLVLSLDKLDKEYDGFLEMNEIYDVKLKADLIVLSACNTALGEYRGGQGIIGMSRAFIASGASSVVVSLWSVSDISTSIFMKKFYTYLKAGCSKAESLRKAKMDLMKMKIYNPDYSPGVMN